MEVYLETGELSAEQIKQGIRERTLSNEVVPVLCGSAFKNKGVQCMLDAIIDYLPAPHEVPAMKGVSANAKDVEIILQPRDDEHFSALAFKIATDPFVGALTFFRVYSGVLNSGDTVYNPVRDKKSA